MKKRSLRAEREFGLIVGAVLLLLGSWWAYLGKFSIGADLLLPLAAVLILLGTLFPQTLIYPNKAWMLLAGGLAYVSTRIILGFVFFAVLTPIALIKRARGWDPLYRRSDRRDSYWQPYSKRQLDSRHYEKMF
jgi:hypothetical protein